MFGKDKRTSLFPGTRDVVTIIFSRSRFPFDKKGGGQGCDCDCDCDGDRLKSEILSTIKSNLYVRFPSAILPSGESEIFKVS
jgi:hypothetical protein